MDFFSRQHLQGENIFSFSLLSRYSRYLRSILSWHRFHTCHDSFYRKYREIGSHARCRRQQISKYFNRDCIHGSTSTICCWSFRSSDYAARYGSDLQGRSFESEISERKLAKPFSRYISIELLFRP